MKSTYDVLYKMFSLIHLGLFSYCVFLLAFKDSQSFFLRHSQSGKCIAAGRVALNDVVANRYWVVMAENCLNLSAQFYYSNSVFLKNIKTGGTFMGAFDVRFGNYSILYEGRNKDGKNFEIHAYHYLKQSPSGSLLFYNAKLIFCAQPSGNYVIDKREKCGNAEEEKFIFGSVTNYNTKMEDVSCSSKQSMLIKRADYGYFNNRGTFDFSASIDKKCSSLTTCKVKHLCGGNSSCELTVNSSLLSPYCADHPSKQLYIEYTCVDTYKSISITKVHPNIRLSTTPGKGFIEIYLHHGDSIWRKVDVKNWDKHRQKMLCKHLGFEETDGNVLDTKELGSKQKIATGDLICYNTQPSGTSCCIHLEPSITSSRVNMTYATCKICDKPLLGNVSKFPDSLFSGIGGSNNYKDARFHNNGWCASGSGVQFLLIDLQEEYHITRVVTLSDYRQTKFVGSFSLKYSRNETSVDQSSALKLTGTPDHSQQASVTNLDIYNVRHMKIESTGKTDFCLRIEVCGEAQLPAPVENLTAIQTNFSVEISWRIPSPKNSSYITHIIVYLDGNERKKIPRDRNDNKFILYGLKPNAEHIVGIQTQDGYLKRSNIIHKIFKANEAEKCVDCQTCDDSHDKKSALALIITLVILSFCFLLSCGVNAYQYTTERRLRKDSIHRNYKGKISIEADKKKTIRDSTEEHGVDNELSGSARTAGQERLDGNDKTNHGTEDQVFDKQDNTKYEGTAKELAAYMSLNDNRESVAFYQTLQQPPDKGSSQHRVKVVEQEEEYVIPASDEVTNDDHI